MNDRSWMAALTGVLFLVLLIVGGAIQGEPPDPADDPVQEIIDFYSDGGKIWVGSLLQVLAAASFVYFAGYMRKILRAAEGEGHMLSAVALAGATILAAGAALDATINIALVETAEDIEPAGVQALSALWNNDFLVLALGSFVFVSATGLSLIRHRALPAWLGWVAIVLAVAQVTPAGFFAFIATALWVAVVSVMLAIRGRRGERTTTTQPPPAAPAA